MMKIMILLSLEENLLLNLFSILFDILKEVSWREGGRALSFFSFSEKQWRTNVCFVGKFLSKFLAKLMEVVSNCAKESMKPLKEALLVKLILGLQQSQCREIKQMKSTYQTKSSNWTEILGDRNLKYWLHKI